MRLTVRVTPRASRDAIEGFDSESRLRVRVTAPPADGAANQAVTRLLARVFALPSRDIVLVSGSTAREKLFDIPLQRAELERRLAAAHAVRPPSTMNSAPDE
jgi:uncharacterized protein (TIGR00251 family)